MPCNRKANWHFYIQKEECEKGPACQEMSVVIESIHLRYPALSKLHSSQSCFSDNTRLGCYFNPCPGGFATDTLNKCALPAFEEIATVTGKDGDGFAAGFQNWSAGNKESGGVLNLTAADLRAAKHYHSDQQFEIRSPDSFCDIPAHLSHYIKNNADILWPDNNMENELASSCGDQHKSERMQSKNRVILGNERMYHTKNNGTENSSTCNHDTAWLVTRTAMQKTHRNGAAGNQIWEENLSDAVLTNRGLLGKSTKCSRADPHQKGDVTTLPCHQVTMKAVKAHHRSARHRPPAVADKKGYLSAVTQVDATASPFSAAVSWMYTPLGPASPAPVLTQRALSSGSQRGHAEDRSVSFSSQASLARSVPAGATLHVSGPTYRVTEDSRHGTRLRSSKARPHPGLAGTCCCCELQDDTDPSLGFSVTGVSELGQRPFLGSKPSRKRVYRIRQPRTLPRFGCLSQVAQKSREAAAGEEETTRTKAAVSGAVGEVGRKRPAVHFVENIDSGQTSERGGESQQNQTSVWNSLQNEGLKIKRERSADVEDVIAAGTTTATTAAPAGGHRSSQALRQQAAQDERPVGRDEALPSYEDYIADGASRQRLVWKVDTVEVDAVYQQETEDQHQPPRRSLDGVTIPLDPNIALSDAAGSDAKFPPRGEEAEPPFDLLNSAVESPCTSDTSTWSSEDNDPSTLDALAKDCSTASWESRESGSTPETVICTPQECRQGFKLRQENCEACESEHFRCEKLEPAEHLRNEAHREEKESCPGDISSTNAELSFKGGKKDMLTKMFGSKTGMCYTGSTDPQSANSSDATDKSVPPSLSGSASDDRLMQATSLEREARTKGELNPTAGEECGKVKHKAIYLKFFSSSVDCTKEVGEKKPASVKTKTFLSWTERSIEDKISACKLLDRQKADSASSNDSEEDDHDEDDKDDGEEVKGTSAFQSVLLTGISTTSDGGKIDRLVTSDQCDLADQSGSKTLASSGSPAGEDRCEKGEVAEESLVHKKERGKIKLFPVCVSKSYDVNKESEPGRHHHCRRRRHHCSFSELELPYESESDLSDASSSSSADSSVSAAHSFCSSDDERAANSQSQGGGQGDRHSSADRKTHGLVTCRRAGSKRPQSSPRRNSAAPTRGVPQSNAGSSTAPSTAIPSGPPVPARRLVSVRRILAEMDVSDNSVTLARAKPEVMESMPVQSGNARRPTEIAGNASSPPAVVWKPRASQRKSLISEMSSRSDATAERTDEEKLSTEASASDVAELPATRPEDGAVGQAAAEDDTKALTASAVERDRQEGGTNESENDVQGDRREDAIANAAETEVKSDEPIAMRNASVSVILYDGTAGSVPVLRSKESGTSVKAVVSPLTKDKGKMANSARRHFVFADKSLTSSSSIASLDMAEVHDTVSVAQRQCADDSQLKDDSQLTVVTPLAEPAETSASTPLSSDKCAAAETDSSELSPLATTASGSDVTAMEREWDVFDSASGEEADCPSETAYEPASLQGLSRFKRAQSVPPEKPPRKPQPPETQSPTAGSASSMEAERDRVYDVPPRRRSVKLPKDVCRPGSVQILKSAFEQEDTVARRSAFRGTQPCSETSIPDDGNPYANDNASGHRDSARTKSKTSVRDRKLSDASDSSVSGESEKSFQIRKSLFLQNDYVTNPRVTQGKNKTPVRRQESGERGKASSKVTENTRAPNSDKQQGKTEEPVVYANSSAVAWFQAETQRDRERRSSSQKDLSMESSPTLAELVSSKAKVWRSRGFRMSSSSFDSERYEASPKLIFRREGGEGIQGKNRGARAASVTSEDAGNKDSGETRVAELVSSRADSKDGTSGDSGVAGASDVMAVAALADATTGGSGSCEKEEEDEARTATQEGTSLAEGEKARRENSLEKQNENGAAVEGKLVKNGNSHTAWHHFGSQYNDGYEDVNPGSQTVHQEPNTPAITTTAGVAVVAAKGGGDSPPVPERNYALRQNKYNEYSNIVRIDSEKLRNARAKSSSTHALFQVTDSDSASAAPMRKTVSLEGGLDRKEKRRRWKTKDRRQPEVEDRGLGKRKTNFSFQKLMSLFRKKRKKQKTEARTGDEEAETSAEEAPGGKVPENFFSMRKILRKMKPKAERAAAGNSAHGANDIRPIGRLLRLNADGTQLVELIRSQGESLGIVLTKGSAEDQDGVFVSAFTDSTAQKFLSGILSVGDEIVKVNDRPVTTSSIESVHNMIMGHLRVKLVTVPVRCE